MRVNVRTAQRSRCARSYSLTWMDESGLTHSAEAQGIDFSRTGVGVLCAVDVSPGTRVYIQAQGGYPTGYSVVRHCTRRDDRYLILGLELEEVAERTVEAAPASRVTDYYEFLQISPNAEAETIHRVYRFLAARYHTDNLETGDPEKFVILNQAFDVLSNPERRAEYDATLRAMQCEPNPAFESIDFLDGVEGEQNRRLAVLSLLYRRCRANIHDPKVPLRELERAMGFPRDYLDFTTWYLKTKKYITVEDNSDFALTSLGVDYVEANYSKLAIFGRLLNAPTESSANGSHAERDDAAERAVGETFLCGPADPAGELGDSAESGHQNSGMQIQ